MERQPFRAIYAVRIQGKDGWQIFNPPVTIDKMLAHLEGQGLKCLEYSALLVVLDKKTDVTELERMTFANSIITRNGWMYDSQRDCWRAPGEIFSEPDEQAVVADSFDIVSDPPEDGWWEIKFVINGKEYWISSSEVYDPLLKYHNLIIAVVRGRDIRITINEERGYFTDISIYHRSDGTVRFILKQFRDNEPTVVDVLIEGVVLVQKLYTLMRDFFGNGKKFEEGWLMESEDSYEMENGETFEEYIEKIKKERGYPPYPVEEIETYLAANSTAQPNLNIKY